MRILIVDDSPVNLKLLRAQLQADGNEVLEAPDGRRALEILKSEAVDGVVTDILMPELDGYGLCSAIRADPELDSLPIIVYTATYVSPGDKRLALEMGADLYLQKPAPAAELCAAIRRLATVKRDKRSAAVPSAVLKQYNESLIRKLEDRNIQLRRETDKLAESEQKFQQIARSIQEVFWMTDAALTQMLYVSPAYEKIWGRSCASLYASPRDWADAVHPEDRERAMQTTLDGIRRGEPYELEYRIVRPDEELRWIKVRAFPIKDDEGKVYRLTGSAADVTEQQRLMGQFLQAQKMEAVGRLAGGVAHDFNNLLTVILGLTEMSIETLPEGPLRGDLTEVRATALRAAQLTQQLLAFSRRQVFEPRNLDINALVRNAERMLTRLIGEDVRLTVSLADGLDAAYLDPHQIEQVLVNLCVNSRDAMPKGGGLLVETAAVEFARDRSDARGTIPKGRYATLSVADDGEGMSPEVLEHLFEPFFTTKPKGKGTGLGLATCYGVVKQSGGHIRVESAPGKGARFTLYFPVVAGGADAAAQPPPSKPGRGRETVLIVEDEPHVRKLTGRILRTHGYTVLEAQDGLEALALARQDAERAIRLVLTDVIMPSMNGRQLYDALRQARPDVRILFTSGYPDETLSHEGVLEPGIVFLRKPFTMDILASKVREVLDSMQEDR